VDFVEGTVRLDNWLNFEMNPNDASVCCALRTALEEILLHVVAQPDEILNLDERYQKVLGVIRSLAEFTAGDFQITRDQGISADRESNFGRNQGPSGFGGGKFQRNDGGGFGRSDGGGFSRGGGSYGSNYQRGGYGSGGFNRGFNRGYNNRGGFGFGR
jgi:ATP-dependent RNA helicase A